MKIKKTEFTKNNSLALKGISIIMMIFHHCFRKENFFESFNISFFPFEQDFIVELSVFFKICVSIFAFITGYGLTLSFQNLNTDNNTEICKWSLNRVIKSLSGFYIVAFLSYIIFQLIDGRTSNIFFGDGIIYGIIQIIVCFLGFSELLGIDNFVSSWWYMSIAILFVISIPLFVKLFNKHSYISVLCFVIIFPRIIGWKYVNSSYISFLTPLLLGIIFAQNNLIVKIANIMVNKNSIINKIIKFMLMTALIIASYKLYHCLPQNLFWEIRYGVIPILLICYLYEFFIDLPVIKSILTFLGKHSLNIFLIHEIFREIYFTDFVYGFKNFSIVAVVLLTLSLITSLILEEFKKLIKYDLFINKLINLITLTVNKFFA